MIAIDIGHGCGNSPFRNLSRFFSMIAIGIGQGIENDHYRNLK